MYKTSFEKLRNYIESQEYKGWDPYDALNSKFFQSIPFAKNSRLMRLIWIQAFKKSPMNFRGLTRVEKAYNPKGLGLFLSGYCKLYQFDRTQEIRSRIHFLSEKLLDMQSEGWSGPCWGYNFDWQARAFFQPKGTPSVVVTTYVGCALLDAYEILGDKKLLETVLRIKYFILKDLNRTYDGNGDFCFSYSPLDETQVFNASLLGSRMLSRIYHYTKDKEVLQLAKQSVQYCSNHQNANGSWSYGTLPYHRWIDNFHTGFNLEALSDYRRYTKDTSFDREIQLGLDYYLATFFSEDGTPKYYSNSVYPIDIHCPAQLPITLSSLNVFEQNKELVDRVLRWTITKLQDQSGYFYFQAGKRRKNKIPYIRWAQAWMFLSLSNYLVENHKNTGI
ncbi:delta-aminolevulinic acid dehydratase [Labilibaculum filiforme]|uniref:Delta-aminolevulinic acid dehydratase n=1 Tax=Labilibaculum filiforme TaxID=1940526 RepID=A0A2N3HYF3_9BACT|nr:delta-aminolevulinic acid dehydratase [Labilibaculum filiforme]PKQ63100.1 delta-aminolevulinic acid dehydratase [Labilibaculum filiforme]